MTGWQAAECEHDLARELDRNNGTAPRPACAWPTLGGLAIFLTAIAATALTQGAL